MAVDQEAQVGEALRLAFAEAGLDIGVLSQETALEDLNLDSLDVVRLAQALEETLGVPFALTALRGVRTVGDLERAAYEQLA